MPDAVDVRNNQLHGAKRARLDAVEFWREEFAPKFVEQVSLGSQRNDSSMWCSLPEPYGWIVIMELEKRGYAVTVERREGKYGLLVGW